MVKGAEDRKNQEHHRKRGGAEKDRGSLEEGHNSGRVTGQRPLLREKKMVEGVTSERTRPILLRRVSLAVAIALFAATLSTLPEFTAGRGGASADNWHDGEDGLGPGMFGDQDRFTSEDLMEHEQYSERLQQQLESLRKEHDVGSPTFASRNAHVEGGLRSEKF